VTNGDVAGNWKPKNCKVDCVAKGVIESSEGVTDDVSRTKQSTTRTDRTVPGPSIKPHADGKHDADVHSGSKVSYASIVKKRLPRTRISCGTCSFSTVGSYGDNPTTLKDIVKIIPRRHPTSETRYEKQ
jgi:hypothetical protein